MNLFVGMGRLTKDVELRYTPSGKVVANFSIAINERKDRDATFLSCDAWEDTGERIAKFFTKGKPIIVQGRLREDKWEDKNDGSQRSRIKLTVDRFNFVIGAPKDSDTETDTESKEEAPKSSAKSKNNKQPEPESEKYDDDIPF